MKRGIRFCLGVALLILAGCSTSKVFPYVQRFNYRNLDVKVIKAPADAVDRHCKRRIKKNDKGQPITGRIEGCTLWRKRGDGFEPVIFVDERNVDVLLHELCHADKRKTPAQCDRVHGGERYQHYARTEE